MGRGLSGPCDDSARASRKRFKNRPCAGRASEQRLTRLFDSGQSKQKATQMAQSAPTMSVDYGARLLFGSFVLKTDHSEYRL
jgi:hypothetical protein